MKKRPVGRFAPTPSGRMHLGNVFAALLSWLSPKSRGGSWILRMEDLDTLRTRTEYAELLRDDLRWLGLTWDEETAPQSARSAVYDRYFAQLEEKNLLFPCYCTRSQLHNVNAPHLSDGTYVYAGTCRDLTAAQRAEKKRAPSWRVRVPDREFSLCDLVQGFSMVHVACVKVFYLVCHVMEQIIERAPELAFLGVRLDAQAFNQTLQICCLFYYCHLRKPP